MVGSLFSGTMTNHMHSFRKQKRDILAQESRDGIRDVRRRRLFNRRYLRAGAKKKKKTKRKRRYVNVNVQAIDNAAALAWASTHTIFFDDQRKTDPDTIVLVHAARSNLNSTMHAIGDGSGEYWGRKIEMTDNTHGSTWKDGQRAQRVIVQRVQQDNTTISLSTYNVLYSDATASADGAWVLNDYELETRERATDVALKHLAWGTRSARIVDRLRRGTGKMPDIMLFQEMTPRMWEHMQRQLDAPYAYERSRNGCCGGDGYVWVCWKRELFGHVQTYHPPPNLGLRWVGVKLIHRGQPFVVSSVHFPSSGTMAHASVIERILGSEVCPVLVGGDFNNTYHPFPTWTNISGNLPTFYNDMHAKFDWVVAKRATSTNVRVNEAVASSHWPNHVEGSDHTAITMDISLQRTAHQQHSVQGGTVHVRDTVRLMYRGTEHAFVVYAVPGNNRWRHPAFFSKELGTLIVSDVDWAWLRLPATTHAGAFGNEGDDYGSIGLHWNGHNRWMEIRKFPSDLNYIDGFLGVYGMFVDVGRYGMWEDAWAARPAIRSAGNVPMHAPATKERYELESWSDGVHRLVSDDGRHVAMLSSTFFIQSLEGQVRPMDKKRVRALLEDLDRDAGVHAFSCYGQHHAVVFYHDTVVDVPITPVYLSALLQHPERGPLLRAVLARHAIKSRPVVDEWARHYAETFNE